MNNQNSAPQPTGTDSPKSGLISHSKRRRLLGVIVLLLVVGLGVVAGSFLGRSKQEQPVSRTETETKQTRPPTISEQADKINFEGDYDKAQAFLDENIAKSSDPKEQSKLYETKALFALKAEKYEDSLEFAQKAEEINATRNSAVLIARSAEGLANKELAIEYYQKVLDRTPPTTLEEDKQYYRDKIKALGG